MTVADKVKADWSKYDMGAKGHLTKAELARWLGDLRTANGEPAPDAKWVNSAFAQTDTDKNSKVSPEELTASLSAGR
jgi:Ca2+-binding EF-hand superfamily protein